MNYELAKELKDAGFPQNKAHFYYSTHTVPETRWCVNIISKKSGVPLGENLVAIPSLEELIDACGKPVGLTITETEYFAQNSPNRIYGSSSTEAVARLWLTLNSKQK